MTASLALRALGEAGNAYVWSEACRLLCRLGLGSTASFFGGNIEMNNHITEMNTLIAQYLSIL